MINYQSGLSSTGYGVVGYNLWDQLSAKEDLTLWPIGGRQGVNPPVTPSDGLVARLRRDIERQDEFISDAPTLKIWHENHLAERIGCGYYCALPFFEISKFNSRRRSHLRSADHLIVTSDWASNIVLNNLGRSCPPLSVIPCGVDRNIFSSTLYRKENDKCVFLNSGKWEIRKGHDILHKAFRDAFAGSEQVELWMMATNPFLTPQEKRDWEDPYRCDKRIKLLDRVDYQEGLAKIMARATCGVFPARSEGWNLELLEMMSMGKPVIATNYSAHTEFCTEDNSLLIDIVEEEPIYDGKWFVEDCGTWACLDGEPYDQLVSHMRDIYETWRTTPEMVNESGIQTAKRLSWESMANQVLEVIEG